MYIVIPGALSISCLVFLFQVPVDHAVPLRERGVEVRMEFGGTEIAVSCYKQHDGDKLLDAKVRLLVPVVAACTCICWRPTGGNWYSFCFCF